MDKSDDLIALRNFVEEMSYKLIDSGDKRSALYAQTMLIYLAGGNPFKELTGGKSGRKPKSVLKLWEAYESACRFGSLNKGAANLSLSRTEVKKRIEELESHLSKECGGSGLHLLDDLTHRALVDTCKKFMSDSVMTWIREQENSKHKVIDLERATVKK